MKELFFNTIQEFNDYIGVKTLHPLVSVVRVENASPIQEAVHHYGLYALFLKENKGCKLSYGRTEYDFDEMTVTSFAPGQSIKVEPIPGERTVHQPYPQPDWREIRQNCRTSSLALAVAERRNHHPEDRS